MRMQIYKKIEFQQNFTLNYSLRTKLGYLVILAFQLKLNFYVRNCKNWSSKRPLFVVFH